MYNDVILVVFCRSKLRWTGKENLSRLSLNINGRALGMWTLPWSSRAGCKLELRCFPVAM